MGHGLTSNDTMFSVRKTPWHGLGAVLDKHPNGIEDALERAGLAWRVETRPALVTGADGVPMEVPNHVVTVRTDTDTPLGVVSDRYHVVQNIEAFQFLDNLIGTDMLFETAGSIKGGRRIWVMTKLPEWIEIGGDRVDQYLGIYNGHDGLQSCTVAVTPIRWVCQNTIRWGLRSAKATHTVRHVGDASTRLHEARAVLGLTVDYYKQLKVVGDKLATQRMTEKQLSQVVGELWPADEGAGPRTAKRRLKVHDQIIDLFKNGETVGSAPGTKLCGLNAITEYADWYVGVRGGTDKAEQRLVRTQNDPGGVKARAFALIAS